MQVQLTIKSLIAFTAGIAGGSVLMLGSALAMQTILLNSSSPAQACLATIPQDAGADQHSIRPSGFCGRVIL